MKRKPSTYCRFVCYRLISRRKHRLGVFQALGEAKENELSPDLALQEIGRTYGWFKANLVVPKPYQDGGAESLGQRGLSWFTPAAQEHIAKMHALSNALSACGVHIEMLTTRDPGAIIYRDRFQVVGVPLGKGSD